MFLKLLCIFFVLYAHGEVEFPLNNNFFIPPQPDLAQVPRPLASIGLENDRITVQPAPAPQQLSTPCTGACARRLSQLQLASNWRNEELKIPVTLTLAHSSLRQALALLSKLSGITFLVHHSVQGQVENMQVRDIYLGQVLQQLCQQHNPPLSLVRYHNAWHIMPHDLALQAQQESVDHDAELQVLQMKHVRLDAATIQAIEQGWQKILADPHAADAYLHIDQSQGKIFFRAPQGAHKEFHKYVTHIDQPSMSVRIDVAIVIADKNFNFDLGFDWSGIYNRQQTLIACNDRFGFVGLGGTLMDFPTPDKPVVNPPNIQESTNIFVDPLNFALNLFNSGAGLLTGKREHANKHGAITLPFVFGGTDLSISRLNAVLNAAQQESKIKITNNPSLLTGNHQTAKLLIGKSIPLQTTIEDLQANLTRNITTVNFKEVGTMIEFTPTIHPDGNCVTLDVYIEDSAVTEGTTRANERGVMVNPPTISMIKIKNRVDLCSGQTTVIGGLDYHLCSDAANVVPLLYRIPLIGWLFQAIFTHNEERERFIFITPTVIKNNNPFNLEQAEGIGG